MVLTELLVPKLVPVDLLVPKDSPMLVPTVSDSERETLSVMLVPSVWPKLWPKVSDRE